MNSNHYHPNELSAELLSIYYIKEIIGTDHYNFSNYGYKLVVDWFNNNLSKIEEEYKKKNI